MQNYYDVVTRLTSQHYEPSVTRMLNDFAKDLGWQPSDRLEVPGLNDFANHHLVVEHGLENTAVLSFLRSPGRYADLDPGQKRRLLNLSYNNLVDWHIQIQQDEVTFVYNRTDPPEIVENHRFSRDRVDALRSEAFEQVIGKRPNPNLPALDDALVDTLSFWKRNLSAEMGYSVSNESLSALLNTIIFVRATEDQLRRVNPSVQTSQALLADWQSSKDSVLRHVLLNSLRKFTNENIPRELVDEEKLRVFDTLDRDTVFALLSDFYRNKYTRLYDYDFSVMSKHALSRIYEHYVSLLRLDDSPQVTLFPRLPDEEKDKRYGSVYTPQYIARFFARYLKEQMTPGAFKNIRTADPACGSGIFVRTLLEIQCDPSMTSDQINLTFGNTACIDVDENACQATRLSLALLHLVLAGRLPGSLNVITAETIEYYQQHPELKESYDAVIVNPPFVIHEQTPLIKERITQFMGDHASGKIDSYLPFLRIGLEMLKPGGYGLFVLPRSFLLGKSAAKMRAAISNTSWIRFLADLSAIPVFDEKGSYVILLIFQKRLELERIAPSATIMQCQDFVGRALQDCVDGRRVQNPYYSIFEVNQEIFSKSDWLIVPPTGMQIIRKFETLPKVSDFLKVRTGLITAADDVFILPENEIPPGEEMIYVPILRDREMKQFIVPESTTHYVFYPYSNQQKISEESLIVDYPRTWAYLTSKKAKLESRKSLKKYNRAWWEPMWSRPPENMMRPKIISPHLVLVPRFSLDLQGKYAISHSPLLYPIDEVAEDDVLRFFVAVLNSTVCYWYINTHSHKYQRGYSMLEPMTLSNTPVPDPRKVPSPVMRRLLDLVNTRLASHEADNRIVEAEIDKMVTNLYGLSEQECRALGMET